MRSVIITGGSGFVGSNTIKYFLARGIRVLSIDRVKESSIEAEGLTYLQCDVFNSNELKSKIPPEAYDTFIHFAWAGSAGPARYDYNLQMKNALMTVECLKVAKEIGCKRFLCAGSIMEYEVETAIHAQGSRPGMGYIYGMGKHIAHCMCKSVAVDIGIELVWPMITNAYGVGELSPRFVNTTLRKMINREALQFTAATQNYDFVYVTDVARAFYLIAQNGRPFCEYMIGSGNARPLKEFIIEMQQSLAPDMKPSFGNVPFSGTNMPLSVFSMEKTEKDTGFRAAVSFAEGTRLTMEWLRARQEMGGDVGAEI